MGISEGIIWGIFGGVLSEVVTLFKLRREDPLPQYLRKKQYWVFTLMMIGAGGILVCAYLRSSVSLNALAAVNIGASAPLVIGSLAEVTLPSMPGSSD